MLGQSPDIVSNLENIHIYACVYRQTDTHTYTHTHTQTYLTQKQCPTRIASFLSTLHYTPCERPGHFREMANCRHGAGNRFGGA